MRREQVNQINRKATKRQNLHPGLDPDPAADEIESESFAQTGTEFYLSEFPKEFKKDHLFATDWRFLSILAFSFVIHAVVIFYLFKHLPKNIDDARIMKIQNHFVSKFLSDTPPAAPKAPAFESELLTSAANWAQALAEEMLDPQKALETPSALDVRSQGGATRKKRSSFESRIQARRSAADTRRRNLNDIQNEVQSVGLLGIISSGSGVVSTGLVEDILTHADSASMRLQSKMEGVTSLQVPKAGVDYFGKGINGDDHVYLQARSVRGARTKVPGVSPADVVATLAATPEHIVIHNDKFETVSNETRDYAGIRTRKTPQIVERTVDQIRETVMSHNPAVQDCYRIALRNDPGLRGKITIRITLSHLGRVADVEIIDSSLSSPGLESCLIRKIRRWNDFGEVPEEQGSLAFRHTYVFGE